MVYLFCSDLLLFSRKFAKIVQDADHYKNGGHKCRKYEHKNFVKTAKARSLFLNLYVCVRSIGRLFTPKPRILRPILNSRPVFIKNQLYFMVKKYNFVAFFQDTFSLCGITPNHLRLRLCLVEVVFFPWI